MTISLDVQTPAKRVGDLIQLAQHYEQSVEAQMAAYQAVRAAEEAYAKSSGDVTFDAAFLCVDMFQKEVDRATRILKEMQRQISELVLELYEDGSLADFQELLNAQISGRP